VVRANVSIRSVVKPLKRNAGTFERASIVDAISCGNPVSGRITNRI
jgi:hypothetical protein